MSINLTSVFSQLNNPSSLGLFAVKDGVDVTGRVGMAYYEGYKGKTKESIESGKHEARERFIDEFGGSLAWMGGVPIFREIYKKTVFKALKLDPEIHLKKILIGLDKNKKESLVQAFAKGIKDSHGHDLSEAATKIKYRNTHVGMVLFSTIIPGMTIAYALPKINKSITAKLLGKEKHQSTYDRPEKIGLSQKAAITFAAFTSFANDKALSFKGRIGKLLINTAEGSQISPVNSMLPLDLGISGGRIASYGRKPQERFETAFKEGGIIFFFFVAGDLIKKGLEKTISGDSLKNIFKNKKIKKLVPDIKLPNVPIFLDPKVIEDKKLEELIKNKTLKSHLKAFPHSNEEEMMGFIRKNIKEGFNPETGEFTANYVLEAARKSGIIPIEKNKSTGKYALNEFKFIETEKLAGVCSNLKQFAGEAGKKDTIHGIESFLKKAKNYKRAGIILNIAICNAFLGFILPKMQYMLRERMTGSNLFPAVRDHLDPHASIR